MFTFAIIFGATIPEAFHRLPRFRITASVNDNFPVLWCPNWPSDRLPCSFSEDMFHIVTSLRDKVGVLSIPPRVQCSLNQANFSLILQPHRALAIDSLAIDPLTNHLTVATQLDLLRVQTTVSAGPRFPSVFEPTFFPSPILSLSCELWNVFHIMQRERDNFFSCQRLQISFLFFSPIQSFFTRHFVADVPTIVSPTLLLPSRVVAPVLFHPFGTCCLPPSRTSPSGHLF